MKKSQDKIQISQEEFRRLVLNQWDWVDHWFIINARYADSIADVVKTKGLKNG